MLTRLALAAFSLVLALAPLAPAAQKAGAQKPKEPPPDYFPLRVGDWWKYRSTTQAGQSSEFTMKVASSDGAAPTPVYLVEIESNWPIREWYSKPNGLVVWHREVFPKNQGMDVSFASQRNLLRNPPAAGGTWSWKGQGMMGVAIDEASMVFASEPIEVPAGKFQAIKVVTKVVQGGAPVTKTYWYANWVGLVRSTTDTGSVQSTTELVDYSFKRPR